jgi:hypothetical protein
VISPWFHGASVCIVTGYGLDITACSNQEPQILGGLGLCEPHRLHRFQYHSTISNYTFKMLNVLADGRNILNVVKTLKLKFTAVRHETIFPPSEVFHCSFLLHYMSCQGIMIADLILWDTLHTVVRRIWSHDFTLSKERPKSLKYFRGYEPMALQKTGVLHFLRQGSNWTSAREHW